MRLQPWTSPSNGLTTGDNKVAKLRYNKENAGRPYNFKLDIRSCCRWDRHMDDGSPKAEYLIDAALVRQLLFDQHPDLANLPLKKFGEGWDNVMFRLGDHYLVRLPRRAQAAALVIHEQNCLPQLSRMLPIAVPAPVRVGVPSHGYPWHWSILPWFDGKSANEVAPHPNQAPKLAEFLLALHQPAPTTAPRNDVRGVPLAHRAVAVEERLARLRQKTDWITPTIERIWADGLATAPSTEARWIHGDLHARNVLVQDGIITGVIDWGDVTSGDVATDLAATWMLFAAPSAQAEVLRLYNPDAATLDRGRAWAVLFGAVLADSGLVDNPHHAAMGKATLKRVQQSP